MYWLLAQDELKQLASFSSADIVAAARDWKPEEHVAASPRGYAVAGGTASIQVSGLLTKKPSFLAWLMGGGTTYQQIADGLDAALADSSVKKIELQVDSGGGQVDGLFELFNKLQTVAAVKPIHTVATKAQSAAYGIAAVAGGKITPTSAGAMFGSVGVAVELHSDPNVISITSTEAPNKRPDYSSEEGRAVIQAELDQMHEIFVSAIAQGRSVATGERVTGKSVNQNYGRGGSFVAAKAYEAGLIDAKPQSVKPRRVMSAADNGEKSVMKFSEFAAAHPEEAKAALDGAKAEERARCVAHMKLAEKSGCYQLAASAIEGGVSGTDMAVAFEHLEAKSKAAKVESRDSASASVDTGVVAPVVTSTPDIGDLVAERLLGKVQA